MLVQYGSKPNVVPAYGAIVENCSQENILNNLREYEQLGVKYRGTEALQNTLEWLKNKYLSYGYSTSQMQEDSYSYSGSTCKNLSLTKIGTLYPNTFVIVDGHYDSVTGTGTNDNGSGVVTILEIARLLQNLPTAYSIKFINFSGEEDGLKGSAAYVANVVNATMPKMDIRVLLNIDEVGGVAGETNNTITCERDTSTPTANNSQSNSYTNQLIACYGLYSPLDTFLDRAYTSDYMSFQSNGEIICGIFEKNETPYKHTSNDLLVNMDPVYVWNVAKGAVGATLHFAKGSTATLKTSGFDSDFQVRFYPNPTKNSLHINKGILKSVNYTFKLVDMNGKIALQKSFANSKLIENVFVSDLPKGIYLAVIKTSDKEVTKKIIID
ncbi:hypothetical protein FNO01nite_19080 [Flavobacterium noncentrifugens]|uniref:Por secretion system C-terminal sorting domain-containing protein n=1 Tax=Flavobacterium noncentrifugens TaxID=1128970 RepID=A0A1G8YI59_9FLAO|nr:M28 family peptidase [Flavobacterium noncentrifugens]GEP51236.1 hypothetical protein FNO01nite_19080 [Flavobacterium noncentrifugens]SDK02522.1 Por secretion system C-terminal sorting domain-containing protein [Flavobacterium noncentrifugens]